jgi:hypothetical protein
VPVVHSTVNVASGQQQPTVPELYPVVDAIGGTSLEAHRAGLERVVQAGAQPVSWVSLACELQRDWSRAETVPAIVEIVLTERLLKE